MCFLLGFSPGGVEGKNNQAQVDSSAQEGFFCLF